MDEASGLIAELQQKLEDLDHKVWLYRRDMTSEFTKYAETLLRDVPEDVSMAVSSAIAEAMKKYPSLDPARIEAEAGCTTTPDAATTGIGVRSSNPKGLTLPISSNQDIVGSPADHPRSPHEREREFMGVFTQSYLPLLDHVNRNERRSSSDTPSPTYVPIDPLTSIAIAKKPQQPEATNEKNTISSSYTGPTSLALPKLPTPKRRNTDEQSIVSDHSDSGIPRRSALRRSSSTSKASPRRVRFEFAGKEFPTTSSPNPTPHVLSVAKGPPIILGMGGEDSDEETGVQLVEDVEEEQPPPRKVSSSQALRALSRGPIEDDGTSWEEVKAPPDGSASVSIAEAGNDDSDEDEFLSMSKLGKTTTNGVHGSKKSPPPESGENLTPAELLANKRTTGAVEYEDTRDDEEEQETLAKMAPLQPISSEKSIYPTPFSPPPTSPSDNNNTTDVLSAAVRPHARSPPPNNQAPTPDEDDDDDLFEFEENITSPFSRTTARKPSRLDVELSDSEETSPIYPSQSSRSNFLSTFSTSPARPIIRSPSPAATATTTIPATTKSGNRTPSGSLRNNPYHPFQTPIVSEAIHAKAASLGEVNSFVGSVNGASGIDEGDLRSFRSSGGVGSFSQGFPAGGNTPMSLSQRLMLEEELEGGQEGGEEGMGDGA